MDNRQVGKNSDGRCSYIYFIQAQGGGPVKIGWTVNPEKRRKALQSASPYKLVIRYVSPGTQQLEHYLHDRFDSCRLEGEWFEAHPDMPGVLLPDGIFSMADWLEGSDKIEVFEHEALARRTSQLATRHKRQQKRERNRHAHRNRDRAFEQICKDLLKPDD